ncbi:MAG: hypothetical protein AAGC56_12025 [Pseudomonadota bacterium]
MSDLAYIFQLGFSGADVWRAIIIAFFFAMYTVKGRSTWVMAGLALLVDRVVWPAIAQSLAGADPQTVAGSLGGMAQSVPQDIGVYLVRYLGLAALIVTFKAARKRVHAGFAKA